MTNESEAGIRRICPAPRQASRWALGMSQAADGSIRNIAPPVPPSPGQAHTAGDSPLKSVGGRSGSLIVPARGIVARLPATAGSTGCVDRSGLRHRRAAPFAAPPRGGLYL